MIEAAIKRAALQFGLDVSEWRALVRCAWADSPELCCYHDLEWGRTPTSDAAWFEVITLETFQAGLSWKTILHKRDAFRHAFAGFEPDRVAAFCEADCDQLLQDASIVRHRKKIEAAVANARIACSLIAQYGSLQKFAADVLMGKPMDDMLTTLQRTFRFVGRTTAESIIYASGLVPPPHSEACFLCNGHSKAE